MLRLIAAVTEAASRHACRVAVCGEAASDPAAIPLLVGLGVDELSVAPGRVPLVKEAVRALDLETARALAAEASGWRTPPRCGRWWPPASRSAPRS